MACQHCATQGEWAILCPCGTPRRYVLGLTLFVGSGCASDAQLHKETPVAVCEPGPGEGAATCILFDCSIDGDEVTCPGLDGYGVLVDGGLR